MSFHEWTDLSPVDKLDFRNSRLEDLELAAQVHSQTEEQAVVAAMSNRVDENEYSLQH